MRVSRVTFAVAIAAVFVAACGSDLAPDQPTPSAPNDVALAAPDRFPPPLIPSPSVTPGQRYSPTTEWRTYASDLYQYEVSYPPTWAIRKGDGQFADEIDGGDLPWLFVRRGLADSPTLTVGAAVQKDLLIEKRDDRAELITARRITLPGGYEGMYLLYHGRIRVGPVTVQRIIVSNGLSFYYFSLYGQPTTEAADIDLFQQIYESWKPT